MIGRKSIPASVLSSSVSVLSSSLKKKMLNEILFYMRKLLTLTRKLQSLQIKEGVEMEDNSEIFEEVNSIKSEIQSLIDSM